MHDSRMFRQRKFFLLLLAQTFRQVSYPVLQSKMSTVAPFGSWKSPITSNFLVEKSVKLDFLQVDGTRLFFSEGRPEERGRQVVCSVEHKNVLQPESDGPTIAEWTPKDHNARSLVHEYGGVSYLAHKGKVYYSNFADQQIYVQGSSSDAPRQVTHVAGYRYIRLEADDAHGRFIAIREDHSQEHKEAINTIVTINSTDGSQQVLVQGADFYSGATVSPDGRFIAWAEWNHPNMPWDNTSLKVAELEADGTSIKAGSERLVAGGINANESVLHPAFTPKGDLIFISDRTDWWNLFYLNQDQLVKAFAGSNETIVPEALCDISSEFAGPHWVFTQNPYQFLNKEASALVVTYNAGAKREVALLDIATKTLSVIDTGFHSHTSVAVDQANQVLYVLAGSAARPSAIVAVALATRDVTVVRRTQSTVLDEGYISVPRNIEYPTTGGRKAFGYFYAPRNKDFTAPENERPPLLVKIHGGPTSSCSSNFNPVIQYFTSRGFAVFDCNYGGSTGYGRKFRQVLNKQWGVVDLDDSVAGALYLARESKEVDEARLVIDGVSAGGYTTLAVLTFRDVFKAGCSNFGVSDLEALAQDTHKFESRYLDQLVGPYPADKAIYEARSPIKHLNNIKVPMIIFQGDEDKIVPPSQAELVFNAVNQKGIPVAYRLFQGEQHGFRQAANIKENIDGEFEFYCTIFGITPADKESLPHILIHNWPVAANSNL